MTWNIVCSAAIRSFRRYHFLSYLMQGAYSWLVCVQFAVGLLQVMIIFVFNAGGEMV